MSIDQRLSELGITLPQAAAPVASYVPAVEQGGMLHISGQISVAEDGGQIGVSGDGFAANGRVRLSFVRGADVKKVELTATPGGLFSWFTRSFDQERVGGAVIAVDLASGQFGVGRTQRAFPAFRPIELPPPDLIPG